MLAGKEAPGGGGGAFPSEFTDRQPHSPAASGLSHRPADRPTSKGVTTGVRLLPHGTVISEDISLEPLEGNVTKVTLKVANKNQDALKLTL